jgi:hypothetical protein
MTGYIAITAWCRTTDGRKVGMTAPVSPEFFADTPALRGYCIAELRDAAARGNPPGVIDEGTLTIKRTSESV